MEPHTFGSTLEKYLQEKENVMKSEEFPPEARNEFHPLAHLEADAKEKLYTTLKSGERISVLFGLPSSEKTSAFKRTDALDAYLQNIGMMASLKIYATEGTIYLYPKDAGQIEAHQAIFKQVHSIRKKMKASRAGSTRSSPTHGRRKGGAFPRKSA